MRGKKGHETSNWVQRKASFKWKVSHGAGWWSRKGWRKGGWSQQSRHNELEIIASIDKVTLGSFQHDWESERRGLGAGPSRALSASSHHIPIIYGYLYSRPNWKVGLWTICMHPHSSSPFTARAHTPTHAETDTLLTASPPKTLPALTHRRERPDALHLWWLTSQEGKNAKRDLWQNLSVKG